MEEPRINWLKMMFKYGVGSAHREKMLDWIMAFKIMMMMEKVMS